MALTDDLFLLSPYRPQRTLSHLSISTRNGMFILSVYVFKERCYVNCKGKSLN